MTDTDPGAGPVRAAAFFDLDRTLMAGSSGYFWARAAYESGVITRRRFAADGFQNVKFRLHGSTDAATDAVRARVCGMIEGREEKEFARLAPRVLAGVLPRLYPQMLATAYAHQDEGRRVYIATAASQGLAGLLADVLAFDGGVGSRYETDADGVYTGREDGPFCYREGKAERVRELAREEGIDLGASYGYSDSESDLPFLRVVGHPVAVNPDVPLATVAAEEGWEVMRFEQLGRRLKAGAAVGAAAIVGTAGATAARSSGRPARGRQSGRRR
jgi:HAD superfamily hydrolase (TIGR01490 family)